MADMPISITGLGATRLAPVVEPMVELGGALHVLDDPEHHGAVGWAEGIRARMSPALAEATEAWSWTTRAIRSTPFVATGASDFAGAIEALRQVPLAEQLLRPVVRRVAASRGPVVDALLTRPAEATAHFLWFLETTWREWFQTEWQRLRPTLAARARRFTNTVARHGAAHALTGLDPSITVKGRGVSIAKVQNARHDASIRGLLVAPSAFVRPHLYVADVPGRPLLLIHPVDAEPPVPSVAELLHRLETVANRGRLEVARAIATEPRTAGEIAALWRIDPTQVTRHLRALAAAGLATSVRQGRFVQYRLDTDGLDRLGGDLVRLLLR
jgi:DNA-binding transcriptional ArsR family regulator